MPKCLKLAGVFLLSMIAGCGGKTTAPFDFTIEASVTEGTAPLEVRFTTTVKSGKMPVIFTWNFGDGSETVYDQNPTHVYETAGVFTATLDATDDAGKYQTKTIDITVVEPMEVIAAADPTGGIAPLLVNFSSSVTGGTEPYTYLWDFRDGETSPSASTSHIFQATGEFAVSLTVTDSGGASGQGEVVVTVGDDHTPVASITANPTVGVAPLEVTFQGNAVGGDPPFAFLWNFGDGETADTQDVVHTFQNPGTYTVVFLVTDDDGDSDDETLQIQVTTNEIPVVEISADPVDGIEPLDVHFMANVAGGNAPFTFTWDFDGDATPDSIRQDPLHTFAAGDHTVTLTVTDDDGDQASDTQDIHVDADTLPEVTATAAPDSGLSPLTVQFDCVATGINLPYLYQWDFGNGQFSSLQSPSYTYTQAGDYVATCTVTDVDGDSAADTAQVQVITDLDISLQIQASPTGGLAPLTVNFVSQVTGGNPPLTYAWDFGDGGTSDLPDPGYEYTGVGTFQAVLDVTDSDGDTARDSVTISVGDSTTPAVTATANPATGAAPLQVAFTCSAAGGNPPYSYHWDFGDGNTATSQNPTHTYTQIGNYRAICTVTDSFSQTGQGTADIQALDPNLPPVIDSLTIGNGWAGTTQTCAATGQTMMRLQVSAHDGNSPPDILTYQWTFDSVPAGSAAAFNNPNATNPTFVPDEAGTYVARVRVDDGRGGVDSGTLTVNSQEAGQVISVSPLPAPNGTAGEAYSQPLVVRVETDCGIPVQGITVGWQPVNGRVVASTGSSDDQGNVEADVEMGCDAGSPARFTAFIPDDPSTAVFNIGVDVGPPDLLLITPENDVPVHDAAGASNPTIILVTVTDLCGNPASGQEVTFDIQTDPGNSACFSDQCPASAPGGSGVKDLTGQSTTNGVATFQLYDDTAESVDIWARNISPALSASGGFRTGDFYDFESGTDGFISGSTSGSFNQEWEVGTPSAGPGGAHSGTGAWATVLDGDYNAESDEDTRYTRRTFSIPCTSGNPVYLKFWEYHDIAAAAVGNLSLNSPAGQSPPAANSASAYDAEINGRPGYQGSSGGWRQVMFDLTPWQCQWISVYWNLYLKEASATAFGWAIDDVAIEYFDGRATGSFTSGPIWDGGITKLHDGVVACATSPAGIGLWGVDQWGNVLENDEVTIATDATGTTDFTDASPGWIVSQAGGGATVNTGPAGATDVWFTDSAEETTNVTLATGSGSDPSVAVSFIAPSGDETALCSDNMDNDCDGDSDCLDGDCASDPVCMMCQFHFDDGTSQGWTFSNSSASVGWTVDDYRSASGSWSMYYGNPATRTYDSGGWNYGSATSPSIILLPGSPALSFSMWQLTEGGFWDITRLYLDDGSGFAEIWNRNNDANLADGSSGGVFVPVTVDLTAWAGSTVILMFTFDTSDGVMNSLEGVYIDEIVVDGTCP